MPYRILIVEDESIIALDIEYMLQDAGFETVGIARDMHAALRLAARQDIDLVTMDIRLANGTEANRSAQGTSSTL